MNYLFQESCLLRKMKDPVNVFGDVTFFCGCVLTFYRRACLLVFHPSSYRTLHTMMMMMDARGACIRSCIIARRTTSLSITVFFGLLQYGTKCTSVVKERNRFQSWLNLKKMVQRHEFNFRIRFTVLIN